MCMSSTLNGSSALQCFENAKVIEICNILISTRECHIGVVCSNRLYSESRVRLSWITLHKTTTYQLTMCPVTCLSNLLRMLEHHYYIFTTYLLRKMIYYVKSPWPEETMFGVVISYSSHVFMCTSTDSNNCLCTWFTLR